ncbi:hypothetical protein M432DRAFT_633989 [Thermoascus aurantiacus ATCC 26904]
MYRVPPNLKFLIDDFEDEWIYEGHTTPGEWVEFQDWNTYVYTEDGSIKGTSVEQYYREVNKGFEMADYVVSPGPKLEGWLREAGIVDIHVEKYKVPIGVWPKDKHLKTLGTWNFMELDTAGGFEAAAMADEVTILVAKAKNDIRNTKIHTIADL